MPINPLDLTQRPPRSARVRLGGYAILPRMLDKGRATLNGTPGEYKYACPMDQQWLAFAGIDPEALKKQLESGKGDGEVLEWVRSNARNNASMPVILEWSRYQEERVPGDADSRKFFTELHEASGPNRQDIFSWFDLLDLDDHVSFGGKA